MSKKNPEVTEFILLKNHSHQAEIDLLRELILSAHSELIENIKWNGPNYAIAEQDRITMHIQPPTKPVQLIFHRGAKKLEQPKSRIIDANFSWLTWKENDRAIAKFPSLEEIENTKSEFVHFITEWIAAAR